MNGDLRSFLRQIKTAQPWDYLQLRTPFAPYLEVTACVFAMQEMQKTPIFHFEKIAGSNLPLVTNVMASRARLAMALGISEERFLTELISRMERPISPRSVTQAPVQEKFFEGDGINLTMLPILVQFPEQKAPYISGGVIVSRDPVTKRYNLSINRIYLIEKNRLGISLHSRGHLWKYFQKAEEAGQPLEIAIVIGYHPALALAAVCRYDEESDEYSLCSGFLGEGLEVVPARTVDLLVPAGAEIVMEARILPGIRHPEGPFAEFSGYYTTHSTENVLELSAVAMRKEAIYQEVLPGTSLEHSTLNAFSWEISFFKSLRKKFSGVLDICFPASGGGMTICYLRVKRDQKEGLGSIFQMLFSANRFLRVVVAVGEDVNIQNEEEVLRAVSNSMESAKQVQISEMEPRLNETGSPAGMPIRIAIDATESVQKGAKRCLLPESTMEKAVQQLKKDAVAHRDKIDD